MPVKCFLLGYYMYANALPMLDKDTAVFGPKYYIQPTRTVTRYCLKFSYLIYGTSLGDLGVVVGYKDDSIDPYIRWTKSGKNK